MSTPTPELGLLRAVDSDDTADYLVTNLSNSLTTVDSLFNNVTGHTHVGSHQGGPITSASITGPYDWPDWFRSTGHTSPFATSGAGMEMFYDSSGATGTIQAFNRATGTLQTLHVNGTALVIDTSNNVTLAGSLSASGSLNATSLTISSNASVAGQMTIGTPIIGDNLYFHSATSRSLNYNGTSDTLYFNGGGGFISGGGYYFSSGTSVYWQWDGTYIHASHAVMSGAGFYFNASGAAHLTWDGNYILSSHGVVSPNSFYFAGNPAYYIGAWDGTYLHLSHSLVINGATLCLNNSSSIAFTWDGTHIQVSQQLYVTQQLTTTSTLQCNGRLITNNYDNGNSNNFGGASSQFNGYVNVVGQVCAHNGYDNGAHTNAFLTPNNSGTGSALAYVWNTFASVDHAEQYGLRIEPIPDALSYVSSINGYSYEHTQFEGGGGGPQQDDGGNIVTEPLYGFKASEVAQYLPELVGVDPQTGAPESIDLNRMLVILWEAFKQHAATTDTRLAQLEGSPA